MVSKEDAAGNAVAPCQLPAASGSRKMYWRSASWSSSRTGLQNSQSEDKDCGLDLNDNNDRGNSSSGHNRRYPPAPLTPRSQQNGKGRPCLPPLQPLSIARRNLDEWPKPSTDDVGEWPQPPTPSGNKNGDRLKIDLSSINANSGKNCELVRRDKIAFFDKECSKVAEHVYLGGDAVAKDKEILKRNGITHVLNCVGFVCPEYFKSDFVYRTLWLQDSPSEDITSILYDVFDYFEDVRQQGGRVFVHCCQGVSRSTSLVIAYLMWREGQTFDDAFQYVKAARGIADPNMGFACQLLQCQKRVHAFPLSPSSLLRMYRMAPHSPYDPLHLVPKMLNDPSVAALDSRGAFIIHVPSAIYIWIGKSCEPIMERDARGAVSQIVRYERAQRPKIVIKEGEEPSYFWDTFSNCTPLMNKSDQRIDSGELSSKICADERKVEEYNVDFEIFHKAIKGGFVPPFSSSQNESETHVPARESSWSLLRQKFAPNDMKEFVTAPAPKGFLSRVYSDSMMIVHSSSPSSSSSSSSPAYLSPDSMSSDSSGSSKYLSESSVDSPSAASSSLPVSSSSSNHSTLSVQSSKSSEPLPKSTRYNAICTAPKQTLQVTSSQSNRSSTSLAERRGSLSKSLKLPVVADSIIRAGIPPSSPVNKEDSSSIEKNFLSWLYSNSCNVILESEEEDITPSKLNASSKSSEACQKEPDFVSKHNEHGSSPQGEGLGHLVTNREEVSASTSCKSMPLVAYCWPGLERIENFSTSNLDSNASFAIVAPTSSLDRSEKRILFLWVGKCFSLDRSSLEFDSSRGLVDVNYADWNQVISDGLTKMGLPKDIPTKIVKENEEPPEFLSIFNGL